MTLERLAELRDAAMTSRSAEPPPTGSEYLTLLLCTERWLKLADGLNEAQVSLAVANAASGKA